MSLQIKIKARLTREALKNYTKIYFLHYNTPSLVYWNTAYGQSQNWFVSLGCPKALVDSERIITQLKAQGYDLVNSYEDAHVVIINTCGFVESAIEESMQAIQEAMAINGRVIVTGCLGAKADKIKAVCPDVLHISGPHAYEEVIQAVHRHVPPPADPFTQLIPPQGIKLTQTLCLLKNFRRL